MVTLTATPATTDPRVLDAASEWLRARDQDPTTTVTAVDLVAATTDPDDLTAVFAVTLQLGQDGDWRDVHGSELLTLLPRLFAALA